MRRAALAATIALLACAGAPLAAQDGAQVALVQLPVGGIVRVTLRSEQGRRGLPSERIARLRWVRADSLRLDWLHQLDGRTVPWHDVVRLDTAGAPEPPTRNRRAGRIAGGTVGGVVGVGLVGLGAALCDQPRCPGPGSMVGGAVIGGVAGALVGDAIGGRLPRRPTWHPVEGLPGRSAN